MPKKKAKKKDKKPRRGVTVILKSYPAAGKKGEKESRRKPIPMVKKKRRSKSRST